ncbi:MAG TPA: AAA domain-containing protein, partial [Myxococcota bacterium]|nr:AAA domain-containing protein [Myxococcota bacterium]
FLDLEGAPFAGEIGEGGREYLFGIGTRGANGEPTYHAIWAESPAAERAAFEEVIDLIHAARAAHPGAHVFHYAPYEPSAFKRLMGRFATRERELDALLRAGAFVDLYGVVRQSLRAGVERYSIKNLEPLYGFTRSVDLKNARKHLQAVELALELDAFGELDPSVCGAVEGYNRDDCISALRLRDWLEQLRAERIASGAEIARPELKSGEASEPLSEKEHRVAVLRARLLEVEGRERYLAAYLLDWHRREDKAVWWEYFRLRDLPEDELLDERAAVAGLAFMREVRQVKQSTVLRFSFPPQELELRKGDELKLKDEKTWAKVASVDRAAHTLDVLIGPSRRSWRPTSAFKHKWVDPAAMEQALFAIGAGIADGSSDVLALELLRASPPKTRDVLALDAQVLAIQGPPGAGKTFTGGQMICDLVRVGKKVGITATGHKVIRNLLDAVAREAAKRGQAVRLAHKDSAEEAEDGEGEHAAVTTVEGNDEALRLLRTHGTDVLGGTAWLWARPELRKQVDVLFIDEAGQMSLANALAVSQAAKSLVLLGDPQQLEQPSKGAHPEGVSVSVLEHMLGGHKTMPAERGVFLPETWRFGSKLCAFTSEVFYENKLRPTPQRALDLQRLTGGPIEGAGLFLCEISHDGNRNASDEEAELVARLVARLLATGSHWVNFDGVTSQLAASDILVVAPFNAHVARIAERAPAIAENVGTVDRFQGREAPVAIYAMATSRPEDAPRGMEFLYSLNRLNVATSRAKCAAIIIANPRLFEPACRSPRQMQLANALCRFREIAMELPFVSAK